jgi:hypothetical protein
MRKKCILSHSLSIEVFKGYGTCGCKTARLGRKEFIAKCTNPECRNYYEKANKKTWRDFRD